MMEHRVRSAVNGSDEADDTALGHAVTVVQHGEMSPEARHGVDQAGHTLYMVKQLEQVIRSQLDELLRPLGLTTLQYTALTVLEQRDGLTSAQLARHSFVRPQTMHEMITSLDDRGFIQRARDPENRRVLLISLTELGRTMVEKYDEEVRRLEEQMLTGLTAHQRKMLHDALEISRQNLADRAGRGQ